jgi:hypothetical protein
LLIFNIADFSWEVAASPVIRPGTIQSLFGQVQTKGTMLDDPEWNCITFAPFLVNFSHRFAPKSVQLAIFSHSASDNRPPNR